MAACSDAGANVKSYYGGGQHSAGVDAVEEFKVQSGTMSAEFGVHGRRRHQPGHGARARINSTAVRSTESLRMTSWTPATPSPREESTPRYNQYGAAAGGRIIRDRTFFFGNFEEYKLRPSSTKSRAPQSPTQREGASSQPCSITGGVLDPNLRPQHRARPIRWPADLFGICFRQQIPVARLDPVSQMC